MSSRSLVLAAVLFAAVVSSAQTASASHFRYGTISWRVPNAATAPRTVEFTVTTGWRTSFIGTTALNFGDGATNASTLGTAIGTGTDSLGNPYTLQQYVVNHTYAGAQTEFTAFFDDCCRVSGLQNGSSSDFRVETDVSLAGGNTTGPSSAAPAIVTMQQGGVRTYTFPTVDADADPVTCRFATTAETGLPTPIPTVPSGGAAPTLSTVAGGCQVTWDLTNSAIGQQYVLHIVLESVHGGQTSSTAIDLIIEIVEPPPPSCAGSGTYVASPGVAFSQAVVGSWTTGGNATLGAANLPSGATLTPTAGSTSTSPFAATFGWTPTAADAGTTRIVSVSFTTQAPTSGGGLVSLTGTCFLSIQTAACAGFGDACTGLGQCATGTIICPSPGVSACSVQPVPESCDNLDNDCDGVVDNGDPGGAMACSSGEPGVCDPGFTVCQAGGVLGCSPIVTPGSVTETCDNQDEDCDGVVDNGDPGGGANCSSGEPGVCDPGTTACQAGGVLACVANITPGSQTETCDNLDNDCDGSVDDGNPGGGVNCSSGEPGVCDPGITACQAGGALACIPNIAPGSLVELCDNLDNDCDGSVDDGNPGGGMNCSSGEPGVCDPGTTACQAGGALTCVPNIAPGSLVELCDNLDNDCDGSVDDGDPGGGVSCSSGADGVCDPGTTACQAGGALACVPNIAPGSQSEVCNGLDDNCDGSTDESHADCSGGTPLCNGAGGCVECLAPTDCDDSDECTVNACASNACAFPAEAAGTTCASGVCDGMAVPMCLPCADTAMGTMVDAGCGADMPICDTSAPGTPACVQCLGDSDCTTGVCDLGTNLCEVCVDTMSGAAIDQGCEAAAALCVTGAGGRECVACVDDALGSETDVGCEAGAPVCDVAGGGASCEVCIRGATAMDDGCALPTQLCDDSGAMRMCVGCLLDDDCAVAEVCNPSGTCTPGCSDDADCAPTPAVPVCDVGAEVCVECIEDSQCPSAQVCSPTRTCVDCNSDAECAAAGLVCEPVSDTCLECVGDADCAEGLVCNANACVPECRSDADCGDASAPVCDAGVCSGCTRNEECPDQQVCSSGKCAFECTEDSECTSSAAPVCDLARMVCVGCSTDAACPSNLCDLVANTCVPACTDSSECSGARESCRDAQVCVECVADEDCAPSKTCAEDRGLCVECTGDEDCLLAETCSSANTCVACGAGTGIACTAPEACSPDLMSCAGGCTEDSDCTNPRLPLCLSMECEECRESADCAEGEVCSTTNRCERPCTEDSICAPGQACDVTTGVCIDGCRGDDECSAPTPVCVQRVCEECGDDTHCPDAMMCDTAMSRCVVTPADGGIPGADGGLADGGVGDGGPVDPFEGGGLSGGACVCSAVGSRDDRGPTPWLLLPLAALALGGRLRRRSRK